MAPGFKGNPYWSSHIAQQYGWMGPPLRPPVEHIRFLEALVADFAARRNGGLKALLLGVTPDIVRMRWPKNLLLIAADNSWPMVDALWAGSIPGGRSAICGDWLAPLVQEHSVDLVIGDGSINCVGCSANARRLAANVSSFLKQRGALVSRCYVLPAVQEEPHEVMAAMYRGEIASCHHFRLRLSMAVQRDAQTGVSLAEVYRHWDRRNCEHPMPSGPGWEKSAVELIEAYQSSPTRYWFPAVEQLREIFHEHFREEMIEPGRGESGECCPTFLLKPR